MGMQKEMHGDVRRSLHVFEMQEIGYNMLGLKRITGYFSS